MKTLVVSYVEEGGDYLNGDSCINVEDDTQVEEGNVITITYEDHKQSPYVINKVLNKHYKYWNRMTGELHNNSNTVRQVIIKTCTIKILAKSISEFKKL